MKMRIQKYSNEHLKTLKPGTVGGGRSKYVLVPSHLSHSAGVSL